MILKAEDVYYNGNQLISIQKLKDNKSLSFVFCDSVKINRQYSDTAGRDSVLNDIRTKQFTADVINI